MMEAELNPPPEVHTNERAQDHEDARLEDVARLPRALRDEQITARDVATLLRFAREVAATQHDETPPRKVPLHARKYTLAELLAQVTDENLHGEIDFGRPVGNETLPPQP